MVEKSGLFKRDCLSFLANDFNKGHLEIVRAIRFAFNRHLSEMHKIHKQEKYFWPRHRQIETMAKKEGFSLALNKNQSSKLSAHSIKSMNAEKTSQSTYGPILKFIDNATNFLATKNQEDHYASAGSLENDNRKITQILYKNDSREIERGKNRLFQRNISISFFESSDVRNTVFNQAVYVGTTPHQGALNFRKMVPPETGIYRNTLFSNCYVEETVFNGPVYIGIQSSQDVANLEEHFKDSTLKFFNGLFDNSTVKGVTFNESIYIGMQFFQEIDSSENFMANMSVFFNKLFHNCNVKDVTFNKPIYINAKLLDEQETYLNRILLDNYSMENITFNSTVQLFFPFESLQAEKKGQVASDKLGELFINDKTTSLNRWEELMTVSVTDDLKNSHDTNENTLFADEKIKTLDLTQQTKQMVAAATENTMSIEKKPIESLEVTTAILQKDHNFFAAAENKTSPTSYLRIMAWDAPGHRQWSLLLEEKKESQSQFFCYRTPSMSTRKQFLLNGPDEIFPKHHSWEACEEAWHDYLELNEGQTYYSCPPIPLSTNQQMIFNANVGELANVMKDSTQSHEVDALSSTADDAVYETLKTLLKDISTGNEQMWPEQCDMFFDEKGKYCEQKTVSNQQTETLDEKSPQSRFK
ncbi:MAG: hypothetical protein ACX932_06345 [Gammaproteobacteria bacterium]